MGLVSNLSRVSVILPFYFLCILHGGGVKGQSPLTKNFEIEAVFCKKKPQGSILRSISQFCSVYIRNSKSYIYEFENI
jgi:hypothetical protein